MPERKNEQTQTQNSKGEGSAWWVPLLIGVMMFFIPGGVFVAPVMILLSIIMKRRKKSPETSPHSPLPLINITH